MSIMSCYTGFFNVQRGWQSLNTGPKFHLRLIRRTGWLLIYIYPTSRRSSRSHFYTPGFPPFRGLVPLGRRNLVPILPPAHPLGGGGSLPGYYYRSFYWLKISQEEFEDTKGVIRIRKSKKNRQHNGQKKKYKQRSTEHTHKTKYRVT
jgi:hypothetical protein